MATSLQWQLIFVMADLSIMATSRQRQWLLKRVPNNQFFQRLMKKSRMVMKFGPYGALMINRGYHILIVFHLYCCSKRYLNLIYNHLLINKVRLPYLFSLQWLVWAPCILSIFYSVFIYITVNRCRVQIKLVLLLLYYTYGECERFEPGSHFIRRLSIIIRVNIVLNRTVVVDGDWRFNNLCGSHLQR